MLDGGDVVMWLDSGGTIRYTSVRRAYPGGIALMFIHEDELYSLVDQSLYVYGSDVMYHVSRDGTRVWSNTKAFRPRQIRIKSKTIDRRMYVFTGPYQDEQYVTITFDGTAWSSEVRRAGNPAYSHFDGERFWGCTRSVAGYYSLICSDHSKSFSMPVLTHSCAILDAGGDLLLVLAYCGKDTTDFEREMILAINSDGCVIWKHDVLSMWLYVRGGFIISDNVILINATLPPPYGRSLHCFNLADGTVYDIED